MLIALLGLAGCGGGEDLDDSCFGPPAPVLEGPFSGQPTGPVAGPVQVCP